MDRNQIKLMLALEALGMPLSLESFPERLSLQKSVYLIQSAGIRLGYTFNWYLRGPYSPSLARDAFALDAAIQAGDDTHSQYQLQKSTSESIKRLAGWIAGANAEHLEMLASVHYVVEHVGLDRLEHLKIRTWLSSYNKNYSGEQIQSGIEELTKHGLLTAKPA